MQWAVRHPTWSCSDGHPSGTGSAIMMPLVFLNVGYSLVSSLKISCQSVKGQETSLSQLLLFEFFHFHSPTLYSSIKTFRKRMGCTVVALNVYRFRDRCQKHPNGFFIC